MFYVNLCKGLHFVANGLFFYFLTRPGLVILMTYIYSVFYTVSKKQSKLFVSQLRQISTNFDSFWHNNSQDKRIM